jgi:hypothetical protein
MKIIVMTVLAVNNQDEDVFVGTSAYISIKAARTALIQDWTNECDHFMEINLDAGERADVQRLYNERISEFMEWSTTEKFVANPNGRWLSSGEDMWYEFCQIDLVG